MKIFTFEFTNFLKQTLICSWKGHKKGKWVDVYWAPGHSCGYRSIFCKVCHKELKTTKGRLFWEKPLPKTVTFKKDAKWIK